MLEGQSVAMKALILMLLVGLAHIQGQTITYEVSTNSMSWYEAFNVSYNQGDQTLRPKIWLFGSIVGYF